MFCSNCGAKAEKTDKFCNECGFSLENKTNNCDINISELKKAEGFGNIIPPKTSFARIDNVGDNKESIYHSKNKKTKLGSVMITIGIFILLVTITIIFINRDSIFSNNNGKRTIMIYMVGSDLESKYLSASSDINEMVNSKADFDNINLLIYTGGAKKWYREEISNEENAIFKVTKDGLEKLETYSKKSMGSPQTLVDFINYSYENYKAEKYSLILWDHGGGPIYGYGYDEYNANDSLTLLELKRALRSSPFNSRNKLEFIGFDACLMATAEVASVLSDYADYMIASQEVEPGAGWNYAFLGSINKDSTTVEIGKKIIDDYSAYYKRRINGKGISLSLLKLNKMDALEEKLNTLFSDVDQNLIIDFSTISRSRGSTKTFGKVTSNGYDLVDLYDLSSKLSEKYYEKVDGVKSAIEDLVVYQQTDLTGTNGISIYFPYENKSQIEKIMYLYKNFDFALEYTKFIDNFSSRLIGTRLYNWNLENTVPEAKGDGVIETEIPKEVADNYSKASYVIFEKMDDDYYIPLFKGTDVSLNGTTLSTTVSKKALVASDAEGEKVYITALESEVGTDYVKYIIPGTLQRWDDDFLSNFEILPVYLQLIVDEENPNGKLADAIEVINNEENETSPKVAIDINNWKIVQLLNYKYKIFDEFGNYTSNWDASGEVTGFESEISDEFNLEFVDLDISKEYYCLFRIADSQGNIYTTNVVKVKNN